MQTHNTICRSSWYVQALSISHPDMLDAILLSERFKGPLHYWLSEGLHIGMPILLDKQEALGMRHPEVYPLLDTGVEDVDTYLHSTRNYSDSEILRFRRNYVEDRLAARSGRP